MLKSEWTTKGFADEPVAAKMQMPKHPVRVSLGLRRYWKDAFLFCM